MARPRSWPAVIEALRRNGTNHSAAVYAEKRLHVLLGQKLNTSRKFDLRPWEVPSKELAALVNFSFPQRYFREEECTALHVWLSAKSRWESTALMRVFNGSTTYSHLRSAVNAVNIPVVNIPAVNILVVNILVVNIPVVNILDPDPYLARCLALPYCHHLLLLHDATDYCHHSCFSIVLMLPTATTRASLATCFFSTTCPSTNLHKDTNDNFACLLLGGKRMMLYPPEDHAAMYYSKTPRSKNRWEWRQ
jgi:hypothetical protein